MTARLKGTQVVVGYDDNMVISVPVTSSLSEVREMIEETLDDEVWPKILHLTVAGEDKESWISVGDMRFIDIESVVLADLNLSGQKTTDQEVAS